MRFRLMDDAEPTNAAGKAALQCLSDQLATLGSIVGVEEEYDALVVSGGSAMANGSARFDVRMRAIALAQAQGKRSYLVNSVWAANPRFYDPVLSALDQLTVRGPASRAELFDRHGQQADHFIDLCHRVPIDEQAPFIDLEGAIVHSQLHAPALGGMVWPAGNPGGSVAFDSAGLSWSSLVRSLRTASILISGRIDLIHAACRARIPFIAFPTALQRDLTDLLDSSRSPIPVCTDLGTFDEILRWTKATTAAFMRMYERMEKAPIWPGIDPDMRRPRTIVPPPRLDLSTESLARLATTEGRHADAAMLWRRRSSEAPPNDDATFHQATALIMAGQIEPAVTAIGEARVTPSRFRRTTDLMIRLARSTEAWIAHDADGEEIWRPIVQQGLFDADMRRLDAALSLLHRATIEAAAIGGPVLGWTVGMVAMLRLNQGGHFDLATALLPLVATDNVPEWLVDHDSILICREARKTYTREPGLAGRLRGSPIGGDATALVELNLYLWERTGADPALADQAVVDQIAHPTHRAIAVQAAQLLVATGQHERVRTLFAENALVLEGAATCPPLASALAPASDDPRIAEMAWLDRYLEDGRRRFETALADRDRQIAVVGNSACELGRKRGHRIDAHDIVIRFNRCDLGARFHDDYGKRADAIVFNRIGETAPLIASGLPDDVIIILWHPRFRYKHRDWSDILAAARRGWAFGYLADEPALALSHRLGSMPSAGLLVAELIKRLRGSIERRSYFAFSMIDQLEPETSAHYFAAHRPSTLHDWRAERRYFDRLFRSH
jgi:hypothetical protein